jgi:hypothetical protein
MDLPNSMPFKNSLPFKPLLQSVELCQFLEDEPTPRAAARLDEQAALVS